MVTLGTIPIRVLPKAEGPKRIHQMTGIAHLVGVCGAGMKALAELLVGLGWKVSGSDLQLPEAASELFARRGLRVHQGHHGRFLPEDADVLVYSPAIGPKNPERLLAEQRGIPQFSYSQMLGQLMRGKTGVSIAGTHGKSTTTAMTATILTDAGASPSVVVGAELRGVNASGWVGRGPLFVVESCEFQRSFLDLSPQYAAILGIEPDHFDYFANFDETVSAFASFAQKVPQDGLLVIRGDCNAAKAACTAATANIQTFSMNPDSDWWAADLRPTSTGIRFRVFYQHEYFTEISLQVAGEHNALNALAAIALCHRAGVSIDAIRDGLYEYQGIRRRMEPVGTWRGITLIDDYAHHPTAVQATLKTLRQQFPKRKIWCVFQPHQVSRTQALMQEFSESFADADETLIVPVFAARERVKNEPQNASEELVQRIVTNGARARFSPTLDRTLATLEDELQTGDVLITMGAGDISQVYYAFTQRLRRNNSPR